VVTPGRCSTGHASLDEVRAEGEAQGRAEGELQGLRKAIVTGNAA